MSLFPTFCLNFNTNLVYILCGTAMLRQVAWRQLQEPSVEGELVDVLLLLLLYQVIGIISFVLMTINKNSSVSYPER